MSTSGASFSRRPTALSIAVLAFAVAALACSDRVPDEPDVADDGQGAGSDTLLDTPFEVPDLEPDVTRMDTEDDGIDVEADLEGDAGDVGDLLVFDVRDEVVTGGDTDTIGDDVTVADASDATDSDFVDATDAEPDPDLLSDPDLLAEPDLDLLTEPDPDLLAEPDPDLFAEPDPDLLAEPDVVDDTGSGPDSFSDQFDDNVGDGICNALGLNLCTLRAAVQEANARPGPDLIVLEAGTYTLTLGPNAEDAAMTGDLDITDDLTIRGQGADVTVISNVSLPVDASFAVLDGGSLVLEDLSLSNGGQALEVHPGGTAVLRDCSVRDNTNSGNGGAIEMNSTGHLEIYRCELTGNSTTSNGGAVNARGTVFVYDSLIADNDAGITSGGLGQNGGSLSVVNSTITANRANRQGGGIGSLGGTVTLNNVTIAGNTADLDGDDGTDEDGGGIFVRFDGTATITNTIVAGNTDGGSVTVHPDCSGTLDTASYNLVGAASGCVGVTDGVSGNQVGVAEPGLEALAHNGGPTQTLGLSESSPAVDNGDDETCEMTDQRGVARPQRESCDIGAFELQP